MQLEGAITLKFVQSCIVCSAADLSLSVCAFLLVTMLRCGLASASSSPS